MAELALKAGRGAAEAVQRVFGRPISMYAAASRAFPLSVAFATCYVKGSASDIITQKWVEKKPKVDWRRNCGFATFSGAYAGCGQHFIYNVLFTRLFGPALDFRTALKKVAADGLVHVPLFNLPLFFMFEDTFLDQGGPIAGLERYSREWLGVMKPYWSLWTFFHLANFRFTPPELRIGGVACMSFIWMIILSNISHQSYEESQKSDATGEAQPPHK